VTDQAESKVRQWAMRRNGETLTVKDSVELVLAVDEDAVARHAETVAVLKQHCTEAVLRDLAIRELQEWRRESSEHCQARIEAIVKAEHETRHAEYVASLVLADRREDDPKGVDYTGKRTLIAGGDVTAQRTFLMWTIGSKLGYVAIAVLITVLNIAVNYLVFGRP
jgi:hypothetical protein